MHLHQSHIIKWYAFYGSLDRWLPPCRADLSVLGFKVQEYCTSDTLLRHWTTHLSTVTCTSYQDAWSAVREYERLHPNLLRQRLGATTRERPAQLSTHFHQRRSLSRPCIPLGPRSKKLVESRPTLEPEIRNAVTVSHQWGIPACIFTFRGLYTLHVWPVSPPPEQPRLHGYVRAVNSAGLQPSTRLVGNIGITPVETYRVHDNEMHGLASWLAESAMVFASPSLPSSAFNTSSTATRCSAVSARDTGAVQPVPRFP